MDEASKSLHILGLHPGASPEDVKKAYRELAMVWHPDRFPDGSPLQAKAQEKLREINAAYEYLMQHGMGAHPVVPPAETEEEPTPPPAEPELVPRRRNGVWLGVVLLAIVVAGVAWWMNRPKPKRPAASDVAAAIDTTNVASARVSQPEEKLSSPVSIPDGSQNLITSMRPLSGCVVTQTSDGMVISGDGRFVTDIEHTPPFAIEAIARTDFTNIRFYYGRGVVILNWEANPAELRHHDPNTGAAIGINGKGRIPVNEWVTVRWQIETNSSTVFVNGEQRASFNGDYSQIDELAGIGTGAGSKVTLRHFAVLKRRSSKDISASLTAGLVLYFPFDGDEKEAIIDRSSSRNHGRIYGAQLSAAGKIGSALNLNANTPGPQFVLVPHSPSLVSMQQARQMTLAAWIKPRSLPSEYPVILGKGGPFPSARFTGYELFLDSASRWDLIFESGRFALKTPHNAPKWLAKHLNDWTHVAVVVNAGTGSRKLYINGRRVGDEVDERADCTQFSTLATNALYIGVPDPKNDPNRARFDGLIDEVRIYARALLGEEIRRLPGLEAK